MEIPILIGLGAIVAGALYFFPCRVACRAPVRVWKKVAVIACFPLFLSFQAFFSWEFLSRPRPLSTGDMRFGEAKVLGSDLQEGRGIYLWLKFPDIKEPRYYVLPWDRKLARQLQEARRQAERNRSGLRMRRSLLDTTLDDNESIFYATPQAKLPQKQSVPDAPVVLQGRDRRDR